MDSSLEHPAPRDAEDSRPEVAIDIAGLVGQTLPPMPQIAMLIMEQFSDCYIDGNRVADLVEQDPAICARLIGLANSAYYGLRNPVADMREVVNRVLGVDNVRNLAFALATQRTFDTSACPSFDNVAFWTESLTIAQRCAGLAALLPAVSEEQRRIAKVFGLCHRLGLLALTCLQSGRVQRVLERVADGGELEEELQTEFGRTSTRMTYIVARQWELPRPILAGYEALAEGNPAADQLAVALTIARTVTSDDNLDPTSEGADWAERLGVDIVALRRAGWSPQDSHRAVDAASEAFAH